MNENWPTAYKEGKQNFYGRDFKVSPKVLIPRPETELLIDELLLLAGKSYLPGIKVPPAVLPEKPIILDVGTGSGIIAVTAKLELPKARVYGLELSGPALTVARKNAGKLGAEVEFLQSNLLQKYSGKEPDVVLANLPYVDRNWKWLDREALSFEPEIALYAEDGGLALIKRLLREIEERAWKTYIILEADPSQHEEINDFAAGLDFEAVKSDGFTVVLKS